MHRRGPRRSWPCYALQQLLQVAAAHGKCSSPAARLTQTAVMARLQAADTVSSMALPLLAQFNSALNGITAPHATVEAIADRLAAILPTISAQPAPLVKTPAPTGDMARVVDVVEALYMKPPTPQDERSAKLRAALATYAAKNALTMLMVHRRTSVICEVLMSGQQVRLCEAACTCMGCVAVLQLHVRTQLTSAALSTPVRVRRAGSCHAAKSLSAGLPCAD
jgi:hypothetical protein